MTRHDCAGRASRPVWISARTLARIAALALAQPALALASPAAETPTAAAKAAPSPALTYADLADLADHAPIVLHARIRSLAVLEPARAGAVRPGWVRAYVEAKTVALVSGPPQTGDSLHYLADLRLDAKGKLPKRGKGDVLLFARPVAGHPGELQLVAPDGQVPWDPETEARTKGVITELLAADAPPRITGVREVIYVAGDLAGEGETQMFLATEPSGPAALTVVHKPGESPQWSVAFSEVLDASGKPPAHDTLAWYRLACFLPAALPATANVSATPADKAQAAADYRLVRDGLGECLRNRS